MLVFFQNGSKRRPNSEMTSIWKVQRIFIFNPILMCFGFFVGFFVEWIVLRAFGSMSSDFFYFLRFPRNFVERGRRVPISKIWQLFFIFHPSLMQVLRSVLLNGLLMGNKKCLLFYFEMGVYKGSNFEWVVLCAFGSIWTLYQRSFLFI